MIDLHCHILPNVDDGAASLEESLEMARLFAHDGMTHVVATPHFNRHMRVSRAEVLRGVVRLNEALGEAEVPLAILPGSEVQVTNTSQYRKQLEAGEFCHLGDGDAFTLLEFAWDSALYPPDAPELIRWLRLRGLTPIVAHPERQSYFAEEPDRLRALVGAGAWLQVTAASLLGDHGSGPRSSGEDVVRTYPDVVLATDSHNLHRCSGLSDAYDWVREKFGRERAEEVRSRAERVLSVLLARA